MFYSLKRSLVVIAILLVSSSALAESFVEFVVVDKVWPEHKWGHVSLRVKTDAQDYVFDFGRYGKMWGFFDTEGEPILRVWKNASNQHLKYQREGNPKIYAVRFQATNAQAQAVLGYFDRLTQGLKPYSSSKTLEYYNLKKPDFHAVNNNCTTVSVAAFMAGLPNMNVNNSDYAKGDGLYWWARSQATSIDYDRTRKRWLHIWWPKDLLSNLRGEFVSKGFAVEQVQ